MKNLRITVNGTAYDVQVEELGGYSAPAASAPATAAPAPAAKPAAPAGAAGSVGNTDLLITWLFKITTGADSKYYMASVIAIMVFVVIAVISLIIYGLMPSVKNEEDFQ